MANVHKNLARSLSLCVTIYLAALWLCACETNIEETPEISDSIITEKPATDETPDRKDSAVSESENSIKTDIIVSAVNFPVVSIEGNDTAAENLITFENLSDECSHRTA